jgi:murein DD-endopeptidase MepM/ murein hydrolase activator NlpD
LKMAAIEETREILDRASFIAFQGASAVQGIQSLSVDSATSELLKNYMASLVYIPQALAMPTDADALDEPWMASASGTSKTISPDGLVVPNLGTDEDSAPDEDSADEGSLGHKFLRLLKPVQNAMISSPFGFRWGRPHQGIDLAAPTGTPVMAAEGGKVIYSGWKTGYGNFVAVEHAGGYHTHYAHCSAVMVHAGQMVRKGQLIAKVGSTGHSTGPHLHFEVVANGVHRNPVKFLNRNLAIVASDQETAAAR